MMVIKVNFFVLCVPVRFIAIAMVLLCFGGLSCFAELRWDAKVISLTIHPLQVEERAEFHFRNTGTNAVDILSVKSTCGCLTPSMSTNRFEAGEAGAVDVVFNLRDKIGPQRKGVAMRSSDHPKRPVILYVETNIRETYTLSSKRLEWSLSGDRILQSCRLINQLVEPVQLISATSSLDSFSVELIPVREGFEYIVEVVPSENASAGIATITIQTECPSELKESRTFTFSAVLR